MLIVNANNSYEYKKKCEANSVVHIIERMYNACRQFDLTNTLMSILTMERSKLNQHYC